MIAPGTGKGKTSPTGVGVPSVSLTLSLSLSPHSLPGEQTPWQVCNLGPKPHSSGVTTGFSVPLSYCTYQHVLHSLISDAGKPSVPRQEMWNEGCWNTESVRQRCCRWLPSEQKSLDLQLNQSSNKQRPRVGVGACTPEVLTDQHKTATLPTYSFPLRNKPKSLNVQSSPETAPSGKAKCFSLSHRVGGCSSITRETPRASFLADALA